MKHWLILSRVLLLLKHVSAGVSYLEVSENDNSWIFIVSLLLFVLRIHTVPRHLEQKQVKDKEQKQQLVAFWTYQSSLTLFFPSMCAGFQQRKIRGTLGKDKIVTQLSLPSPPLCSTSPFTDLISTGNFLHFPETGVEFANEVMLPPGVMIPH